MLTDKRCTECNARIDSARGPLTSVCSTRCHRDRRKRMEGLGRKCSECEGPLPDTNPNRKTCGPKCNRARESRLQRVRAQNDRVLYTRLCDICGQEFQPRAEGNRCCSDPNCQKARTQQSNRTYWVTKKAQGIVKRDCILPSMFVNDPWSGDTFNFGCGPDGPTCPQDARSGLDPLPSDHSPIPYRPKRQKGVYGKSSGYGNCADEVAA